VQASSGGWKLRGDGTITLGRLSRLDAVWPSAGGSDWSDAYFGEYSAVRFAGLTGARNLSGISGGADGLAYLLINFSSYTITLTHNDGASASGNRFYCPGAANVAIRSGGSIWIIYNGTNGFWMPVVP
jgi:hypothetical protein